MFARTCFVVASSKALVTSSRISSRGLFMYTLAIANLYSYPPERQAVPLFCTSESNFCGRRLMNVQYANSNALYISSSVASCFIRRRLSRMVPSKKIGSYATNPTD